MGEFIPDRATVQMACGKAATVSGTATILIKIPAATRKIAGGSAWFETPHFDEKVKIYVTDEDNLLGYGAGFTVGGYTDADVPADNQGLYIPKAQGFAEVQKLVDFATLPALMYLKIVGITGDNRSDTLRVNLAWGKPG